MSLEPSFVFDYGGGQTPAAHQLGKVAAIELAPFGIRVNMINPDAVFGDSQIPADNKKLRLAGPHY